MVLPSPDQQDLGFPDLPTSSKASVRTLFAFQAKLLDDLWARRMTLFLTLFLGLVFTKAGENILSIHENGPNLIQSIRRYISFKVCNHCNYQYIDLSVLLGLILISYIFYRERRSISKIVDLSARVHLHNITATVALLIVLTYCLIELLFGPGEGYAWASDYVVAYAAAWALRLLLSWREYGGRLSDEANLKAETLKADEAAKSGSAKWFDV